MRLARFGLIPRWCRDAAHAFTVGRGTCNARIETVGDKPSFRGPRLERRWALVPLLNYFEPCWETGRSVRWRIARADGEPMLVAGLHEHWVDAMTRALFRSFTLLTRHAFAHPLLLRMHRPGDEKRQVCTVPSHDARDWLNAPSADALPWLLQREEVPLMGQPAPLREDHQAALSF